MTEQYVCDSSVALRWFLDQVGYERARLYLDRAAADEVRLVAPSVLLWEVGNILLKRGVREGRLDPADLASAIVAIRAVCEIVDVTPERAALVAVELGTSYFDAAFAAVSIDRGLPVLTADERFARGVAGRLSTALL